MARASIKTFSLRKRDTTKDKTTHKPFHLSPLRPQPHLKLFSLPSLLPQKCEDDAGAVLELVRRQISEPATESRIARFQVIRRRPSIKAPMNRRRFFGDDAERFSWSD